MTAHRFTEIDWRSEFVVQFDLLDAEIRDAPYTHSQRYRPDHVKVEMGRGTGRWSKGAHWSVTSATLSGRRILKNGSPSELEAKSERFGGYGNALDPAAVEPEWLRPILAAALARANWPTPLRCPDCALSHDVALCAAIAADCACCHAIFAATPA